jgi:enamine deaminase RidA (YjgF/YER057c/UK114 family)
MMRRGAAGLAVIALAAVATSPAPAQGADTPEARLAAAGLTLPEPPRPIATYVTAVESGNLLFLSGHGECGQTLRSGAVGRDLTLEDGRASARRVALCMLATIKAATGDLSRVRRMVRILGLVQSADGFTQQPAVMNGFSEVFVIAFGEAGKAARAAVGVNALPGNIPVEVEAIAELYPRR